MGPSGKRMLVALLMVAGLWQSANAASKTVGGSTGWNLGITATFYDDWAKSQTFAVGDTLVFTYAGVTHNVFEVNQQDLTSCNIASPLKTYETSGGASVPIATSGTHYYICGVPGHCTGNMAMTISVAAAATPPTPAPVATPPTPAPVATPPTAAPVATPPTPAPVATPPTPAPATATPVPAPATRSPSPAPAKSPSAAPSTSAPGSAGAPGPSASDTPGGGASSLSGASTVVGAVLCVAIAVLFH